MKTIEELIQNLIDATYHWAVSDDALYDECYIHVVKAKEVLLRRMHEIDK